MNKPKPQFKPGQQTVLATYLPPLPSLQGNRPPLYAGTLCYVIEIACAPVSRGNVILDEYKYKCIANGVEFFAGESSLSPIYIQEQLPL